MNVQEAVDFPRIHHQWLPDQLVMERGFSPDTIALLKARGHQVRMVRRHRRSGRHSRYATGGWKARADPRTEGTAKGLLSMRSRSFHASVRQSPADGCAARQDSARGDSGRGDLLRAAAPGLPRSRPDHRTGPLVSRLGLEAAFPSRAHVHRRDLGPLGAARGDHITEPVKGKRLEMVDEIKRALEIAETIPVQVSWFSTSASPARNFPSGPSKRRSRRWSRSACFARQRGVEMLLENIPNALSTRRAPDGFPGTDAPGFELRLRHGARHIGEAWRRRST